MRLSLCNGANGSKVGAECESADPTCRVDSGRFREPPSKTIFFPLVPLRGQVIRIFHHGGHEGHEGGIPAKGYGASKPTRCKVRSSAIWSKCGSVQVENNRARSARFSYRFGSPSGRIIAKPFRLPFRTPFSPGRCPGLLSYAPSARRTLNLTCRLPSGCGPLRANPIFNSIFVFFVAFVAKKIRIGNRRPTGTPLKKRSRASQEQDPGCWRPTRSAFPPPFAKASPFAKATEDRSEGRPRAGATRL